MSDFLPEDLIPIDGLELVGPFEVPFEGGDFAASDLPDPFGPEAAGALGMFGGGLARRGMPRATESPSTGGRGRLDRAAVLAQLADTSASFAERMVKLVKDRQAKGGRD
jgi:hypothetical protein